MVHMEILCLVSQGMPVRGSAFTSINKGFVEAQTGDASDSVNSNLTASPEELGDESEDDDPNTPAYACFKCKFTSETQAFMKLHLDSSHKRLFNMKKKKEYPCSVCGKNFSLHSSLWKHMKTQHEGKNPTYCELCDKHFQNNRELSQHLQFDHEKSTFLKCKICEKRFKAQGSLIQHMKTVHDGVKVSCNQCGREFGQRSALKRHVMIVHEGFRFKCDQCDFTSVGKHIVTQHIEDYHETNSK